MKKNIIISGVILLVIIILTIFYNTKNNLIADLPLNLVPEKITYSNASSAMIRIISPLPGAVVGVDFNVIGEARGNWYFEASFPIKLLDNNGKLLATAIAQAEGEWMTADFVPFKANFNLPIIYSGPATLILNKDNPSDMRQFDASISYVVILK